MKEKPLDRMMKSSNRCIKIEQYATALAQARAAGQDVLNFCLHHQGHPACSRLSESVRQLVEELHQLRINSELMQVSIDHFASRLQ